MSRQEAAIIPASRSHTSWFVRDGCCLAPASKYPCSRTQKKASLKGPDALTHKDRVFQENSHRATKVVGKTASFFLMR